jgi:predicted ATPase
MNTLSQLKEVDMKRIITLHGGPGSGKSTTCAGIFYEAKKAGINAEMNREYIKEWIWEGRDVQPGDQTYFFAKQARKERIYMARGVDLIITDSPLILTHFFGLKYDKFEREFNTSLKMLEQHHAICKHYGYKIDHFFVPRHDREYNPDGRNQTKEVAMQYDTEIKDLLDSLGIKYHVAPTESLEVMFKFIRNQIS